MRLDMSYSTCEPLPELQDNRDYKGGSMPGSGASTRKGSCESRNSGNFFPQISRSKGCSSAESTYNDDNDGSTVHDGRAHSDTEQYNGNKNTSRTSYASSVGTSDTRSPTKFPHIDVQYNKSKSVTSLCSNRSRNTPPRAEMCKSPSCPSLWSEYEDPGLVENGDLNASIHPHHTRKSTGDCVKLPEVYDNCTPRTNRSNSYNRVKKSSKIEKELEKLSMRRQREEEERKQRIRKTHRQQQLDRQSSQPTALLLPIRNTDRLNRAKKDSQNCPRQRRSESSSQSYNSSYSVKSDSGISTSLRQSDTSDTGWEEGEQYTEGQRDDEEEDDDEYEDAEDDDPGYEEEDEYEDANDGDNSYDNGGQGYYEDDRERYEEYPQQGDQEYYYEQYDQGQQNEPISRPIIPGYQAARHRRYKVAQSQNAQDYQPRPQLDSTEKCQEWLHGRRKRHQEEST